MKTSGASCPIPSNASGVIQIAHGGGGRLMNDLIGSIIAPIFADPLLDERHDGAVFAAAGERLAFTTDSYVVKPLFFPGGDIGTLAVNGTINDLAMCAASPLFMSVSFIIEEGFAIDALTRVVRSMADAAKDAGVRIVTGDTKVVERGKGDGLFVNTTGIGPVRVNAPPSPRRIRAGDAIVLSGDVGRHGIAIMAARESLAFETEIASDCAPLWTQVNAMIEAGVDIHCMRDLTRGGLAAALIEIAETAGASITIDEQAIEVSPQVRAACELLGLDPIHVANEGRFIAIVPETHVGRAVDAMTGCGAQPKPIGRVTGGDGGCVLRRTRYGASARLTLPAGELLPRIC